MQFTSCPSRPSSQPRIIEIPGASCNKWFERGDNLDVQAQGNTCDRFNGTYLNPGYVQGLTYDDVTCTPLDPNPPPLENSGCNCATVIDSPGESVGTYTVAGNVLTTSNGAEYSCCVEGKTLTLTPTNFRCASLKMILAPGAADEAFASRVPRDLASDGASPRGVRSPAHRPD